MAVFQDPCALNNELAAIAERNYGETTERRVSLLKEMRDRIQALPEEKDKLKDLSDENLIRFLRCRKFDLDRAVKLAVDAKHFYDKNAEVLKNLDGKESIMFDGELDNFFQVYRNVDEGGKVVAVVRSSRLVKVFQTELGAKILRENPNAMLRFLVWLFHNLCRDPHVQVGGLVMLNSFSECSFYESMSFANVMTVPQRGILIKHLNICGIRMKGMLIFEEPSIISALFFILKQFMSEKLKKRVQFCGSQYGAIRKVIEGDLVGLPVLFGGQLDDSMPVDENSRKSFGAVNRSEDYQWDP